MGEMGDYFSLLFLMLKMYDKDTLRNAHETMNINKGVGSHGKIKCI